MDGEITYEEALDKMAKVNDDIILQKLSNKRVLTKI